MPARKEACNPTRKEPHIYQHTLANTRGFQQHFCRYLVNEWIIDFSMNIQSHQSKPPSFVEEASIPMKELLQLLNAHQSPNSSSSLPFPPHNSLGYLGSSLCPPHNPFSPHHILSILCCSFITDWIFPFQISLWSVKNFLLIPFHFHVGYVITLLSTVNSFS